ncbi:hypothetical protein ACJVC5_15630 [Peredibacter sp. HCB2-198]|uniref:hypothetical protein n=1 Tax=Peredibacter sp. HCB2-198 TaxID=3383025 RepID=UPI0038B47B28
MELEQAIELLKTAVKNNGVNDERHIDLTLVPVEQKAQYEKALVVSKMAILDGKMTQDEFKRLVHLDI